MEGWIVAISLTRGRAEKLSFAQLCFFFEIFAFFPPPFPPVQGGESAEQRDDLPRKESGDEGEEW